MRQHRTETASGVPSQRQLRVAELIRKTLSEMLTRGEIQDPELETAIVTIPEVRMSPDLKLATVFVEPLGGARVEETVKALARNARFIRGQVAKRVNLRFAPDLRFRHDTRFDEAGKIDTLLRSPKVARDLDDDEPES